MAGNAKVQKPGRFANEIDLDILWFNVAVNNASCLCGSKRLKYVLGNVEHLLVRKANQY